MVHEITTKPLTLRMYHQLTLLGLGLQRLLDRSIQRVPSIPALRLLYVRNSQRILPIRYVDS